MSLGCDNYIKDEPFKVWYDKYSNEYFVTASRDACEIIGMSIFEVEYESFDDEDDAIERECFLYNSMIAKQKEHGIDGR